MLQPRTVTIRALAAVAGAVALLSIASPASAATPDEPVHRDIDDYVLFATEKINIKGQDADATRGYIHGGDVGVNNPGEYAGDPRLQICSNGKVFMDAGTQLVGDTMRLTNDCNVYDVYANTVAGSGTSSLHSGPTAFSAPIIANLPQPPAFACNANAPIRVEPGDSLDLVPGTYGDLWVEDGGTLTLHAGTYTFCDWNQGKDVTVHATNDTVVQIERTFTSKNNPNVAQGACGMRWWVLGQGPLDSNKTSVSFGKYGQVWGKWWNLNGKIDLGHATDAHGQFVAEVLGSDWDINVSGCQPQTVTTTTTTTMATTTTTTIPNGTTTTTVPEGSTTTTTIADDSTTTTTTPDDDDTTTTTVSKNDTTTTTLVASEEAFEETEAQGFLGGSLPFTGGGSLPLAGVGIVSLATGAAILLRRRALSRR